MKQSLRSHFPLLAGSTLLLGLGLGLAAPKDGGDGAEPFAKLERGMTPDQVRERVGPPRRTSRQILSYRYVEQWIYGPPSSARLQFDCLRGQKPQLVSKPMLPSQ
jgi:hypothetical protein